MSIQSKNIVFTGKISKPRHEFQTLVEEHGGIAQSDVSSNTDYLVVGEKPGSKLFRATQLGIPSISEEEFLKLLEEEIQQEEEEEPNPCGTGPDSISHFWFRATKKENGTTVKECLCGTKLTIYPDGRLEKHEPRYIIERAKKIAHKYAIEQEREFRRRQEGQEEREKEIAEFIQSLLEEQVEQLRRQLSET